MAFIPDTKKLGFVPDTAKPGDIDSANAALAGRPASTPDATETANVAANATEHGPVQDVIDMIRAAPEGIIPAIKGMVSSLGSGPLTNAAQLAHAVRSVMADPSAALSTVKNATPQQVGKNILAPALVGAGANELGGAAAGLADTTGAAAAEAATPAGQLGLRSTQGRPVATTLAGPTAAPTLDAQNQTVAHTVLGADVGVPHGTPVNPTSLEAARAAPGTVLDEGAASLPTAPLSPSALQKVAAARGPATITKPTPNVASQIEGIENALLEPGAQFSGEQIRATRNSLSSDASAGMNSDDADTRAIAKYKRGVIDALDQHVADTMPADSAISPDMIANARATLAKNYSLQDLIGKGGDINLQGLAKLHRDNPNLLSGNMRTVAEFANQHPEVTGGITEANRIAPPSLGTDLAHVNILNPRSWAQPLFGAMARSSLRGGSPMGLAESAPVAGAAGEFSPLRPPYEDLPPSTGSIVTGRNLAGDDGAPSIVNGPTDTRLPPTGRPGDIDLMDLLSHGVEQHPAAGLSLAPMGAPAPEGIPFARDPGAAGLGPLRSGRQITENAPTHILGPDGEPVETGVGGGPQLADRHEPTLQDLLEQLSDHPAVMHQNKVQGLYGLFDQLLDTSPGVPEGTMTRTANNASGESPASLEAINRTRREQASGQDRFLVDPDGKMWPVRGVEAADASAPKGSIIIQKGVGGTPYSILDRGGLPRAHAEGLMNRALAGGNGLSLMDLLGG